MDHLDLTVAAGEIFGLVGPDGAGKTTTLRMLCGLMDPSEGSALVAGHDVARESRAVKDQIGYMAQRFGLYQDLTVEENMDLLRRPVRHHGADARGPDGATAADDAHGAVPHAAGGQALGRHETEAGADVHAAAPPRILFLDEPTNGVDPVSRRDFWAILYQLVKDGITIFMTTAYLDEAERCNRVGLLHKAS